MPFQPRNKKRVDIVITKWFYHAIILSNVANLIYFQQILDAVAGFGPRYKSFSVYDLSGYLLRTNYEQIQEHLRDLKRVWTDARYIIMADGWIDTLNWTLVNFLVYFPKGTMFIKSVDASNAVKTG